MDKLLSFWEGSTFLLNDMAFDRSTSIEEFVRQSRSLSSAPSSETSTIFVICSNSLGNLRMHSMSCIDNKIAVAPKPYSDATEIFTQILLCILVYPSTSFQSHSSYQRGKKIYSKKFCILSTPAWSQNAQCLSQSTFYYCNHVGVDMSKRKK